MIGGKIVILITTSLGVVYRSIYTEEINTVSKFIISLIFSLMFGLTWIEYVEEEKIRNSVALLIGLIIGVIGSNFTSFLLKVGKSSEDQLVKGVTFYIKKQLPESDTDTTKTNDTKNVND